MAVLVVGLSHKTAPIDLLERLAVAEEDLSKALHQLATYEHVLEATILSTCNRVEVYAVVSKYHGGAQDLRNFLAEFRHVAPEEFADHLYTYHDDSAVGHLFRVAAGIDSMVIGESEILGQVRRAHQAAVDEGLVHRVLGRAFDQAIRVGKRARAETAIARNPASISSAAVDLARRAFAARSLENKRVVIVGAGKMGRLTARALGGAGATDVVVVNRTRARARELAEAFGARAAGLDELVDALAGADIVICSTTAPATLIDRRTMEAVLDRRAGRGPLFVVDIAVPRDVEPAVADLDGVVLRDIDDLRGVVESSLGSRLGEVGKVEDIVAAELARFTRWERASEIAPTVSRLVARAEAIRAAELRRSRRTLTGLSEAEAAAVDRVTRRIVAKLLHEPLERAKELGDSKQGHAYLAALRELFDLDDDE